MKQLLNKKWLKWTLGITVFFFVSTYSSYLINTRSDLNIPDAAIVTTILIPFLVPLLYFLCIVPILVMRKVRKTDIGRIGMVSSHIVKVETWLITIFYLYGTIFILFSAPWVNSYFSTLAFKFSQLFSTTYYMDLEYGFIPDAKEIINLLGGTLIFLLPALCLMWLSDWGLVQKLRIQK